MIRALTAEWKLPADTLVREYDLAPSMPTDSWLCWVSVDKPTCDGASASTVICNYLLYRMKLDF